MTTSGGFKHPHAEIVERWFREVWNEGKTSTIHELFPQDGIVHGLAPQGAPVRGPEGFKAFFQTIRGTFPDIKVTIHDTVVEGDKVAARWSATMTHSGKGLDIPPTGKKVQTTGMLMCRIRDGQIIESWDNWDALGLMEQLGVVPQSKMV
jgi:steroid delta-isomerase-like uncharacterized protein